MSRIKRLRSGAKKRADRVRSSMSDVGLVDADGDGGVDVIILLAGIVLLVVFVSTGLVCGSMPDRATAQAAHEASLRRQGDLESEIEEVRGTERLDAETARRIAEGASKAGQEVAKLQNAYLKAIASGKTDNYVDKGTWSALRKAFGEEVGGGAVTWLRSDEETSSHVKWEYVPTNGFSLDGVACAWLCRDDEGTLLGYASAQYELEDGKLHNLVRGLTSEGHGMALGEGANELKRRSDGIRDLAEKIGDLVDDYEIDEDAKKERERAKAGAAELRDQKEVESGDE